MKIRITQCREHLLPLSLFMLWFILLVWFYNIFFRLHISFEELMFLPVTFLKEHIFLGICLYVLVYIVRPLFFIIATPLDIFIGFVFGPIYGCLISILSVWGSTMFSYGVGYMTWGRFLKDIPGTSKVWKLKKRLKKDTFHTAVFTRIIFLPFDLTNYLAGTFWVPFWKYVAGTTLGVIPITFSIVLIGAAFHGKDISSFSEIENNIDIAYLFFAAILLWVLVFFAKFLQKHHTKTKKTKQS